MASDDAAPLLACPCCGYATLPGRDDYDSSPICFWEDEGQDLMMLMTHGAGRTVSANGCAHPLPSGRSWSRRTGRTPERTCQRTDAFAYSCSRMASSSIGPAPRATGETEARNGESVAGVASPLPTSGQKCGDLDLKGARKLHECTEAWRLSAGQNLRPIASTDDGEVSELVHGPAALLRERMGRDLAVVRGGVDYAVDRVVEETAPECTRPSG